MKSFVTGVVVVALAACSPATPPAAEPAPAAPVVEAQSTESPDPETAAVEPEPAELAEPEIGSFELLDAGAEPRRQLRFALTPGSETRRTFVIHVLNRVNDSDGDFQEDADDIQLVVRAEVGEQLSDRSHWITFEIESAANLNDPSDAHAALVTGIVFRERRSDRGLLLEHGVDSASGMQHAEAAALVAKLRHMAMFVVFPQEDIGVGARWRTVVAFDDFTRRSVPSINTFELGSLDGEAVAIRVDVEMSATDRPIFSDGGPMGTPTPIGALDNLTGRGTGHAMVTLDEPMVTTVEKSRTIDVEMSFHDMPGYKATGHSEVAFRVVAP
jgi:hypothetical protein